MNIQRGSGLAVWRQIARQLEQEVAAGAYAPGDKLPSENELAQRFGVNRHTVRQAVASLARASLLRVEQGRGVFVREASLDYALGPRTRFSENMMSLHRQPTRDLLEAVQFEAAGEIVEELQVAHGAPVWRLETLNKADGRPIGVASHYFSAERFPKLAAAYRAEKSITGALRRMGVAEYRRKVTRIRAAPVSGPDARLLGVPRRRPVLITEAVNVDELGRVVEFGRARMVADLVTLTIEH